jgi:hypothetical protein
LASQLRFEGAVLEDLLDRVRTEVGPDARIVGANRIRKGGVGGFFAREGFEVIVDLTPDEGGSQQPQSQRPPARTRRPARIPASVLDLADDISTSEREQIIDLSDPNDPREPMISTETRDFGSMLEELSRQLDEDERDMPTSTLGAQPSVVPVPEINLSEPAMQHVVSQSTVQEPAMQEVIEADPMVEPPVNTRAHYRRVTVDTPVASAIAAPLPTVTPPPRRAPMPTRTPAPDTRLRELGLPRELIPSTAAAADLRTALFQRLSQLPPPPMLPRSPGVVVAVVGIGTAPIALARRIADELEIDPDHLVLATPEPVSELSHPDEAQTSRQSWRRRPEPTVVACSIGAGRAQLGWAHRMLDKLEPTVTWAVVEASCKAEDIAHRVTLLGGVDVLALNNVADTVSPAEVLQLGIPVGRLGAKYATPAAWADLLMEQLDR